MSVGGPERLEKAETFYRTTCAELVAALDAAIPAWLTASAAARGYRLDADDPLVVELHATMMRDLGDAYRPASDPVALVELDSVRNPLDIVRRGIGPLNARLAAEAVPAPDRDEAQIHLFPDDLYDLAPGAFIDLGDEVHHAGLRWGAAKAHLHLIRHRPPTESTPPLASVTDLPTGAAPEATPTQPSENGPTDVGSVGGRDEKTVAVFAPDLMDQSRLRTLGRLVRLRSADDVATLGDDVDVVAAALDVSHDGFASIAQALRDRWPNLAIIGYGPHVDEAKLAQAADLCTEVLPRSVFFSRVQRGTLTD